MEDARTDEQTARLSWVMETRDEIAAADLGLDVVARLVAERAKELTCSDNATVSILDEEGERLVQIVIGEAHAKANVHVPLVHRGREIGSLSLAKEPGVTDDERWMLEVLAILLCSAVSDAAEREARRDQTEALSRFETVFQDAPIGIAIVSLDGRLRKTNPAMRDITGRSAEDLASRSALGYTVPEDIDELVRLFSGMVEGQHDSYRHEIRLYADDGEVVWVDTATALLRDADGKPQEAVSMAQNITKRRAAEEQLRQSEARYRTLVEQLPLITYIDTPYATDAAAAPYLSPQIEQILGYGLEEWHATPNFFLDHLHPEDRDRVHAAQQETRQSAEPLELEYRLIAADGRVVWLKDSYIVVRDETGRPSYTQGFAVDVTAQKQGEQDRKVLLTQAQEQNERLRKLDRMKDEFIALVSHELRTPLTSICGYLELLLQDDVVAALPEALTWLEVIDRNAERLLRLVEDLLLTAQASTGNLALEKGELDVAGIVAHAVQAGAPLAAARGIALTCTTHPLLPSAYGDRLRIGQVIDNLVSNALKFTPAGGTVDVRAHLHRGAVRIEVADTGLGIADDDQAHLFEQFFRTASAQEQAIPGVGLGLSISKAIVEAHEGRISVKSTEGVGTTFFVDLPAIATRPQVAPAA